MNKQLRQFTIREILNAGHFGNQEDLARELRKAGAETTQATLSRDLSEMGVARISTPDGAKYIVSEESEDKRVRALLSYEVTSIRANESMIVVTTLPGRAQGVAELLDSIGDSSILGTIAGDNTIFIAPTSVKSIAKVVQLLREFITA